MRTNLILVIFFAHSLLAVSANGDGQVAPVPAEADRFIGTYIKTLPAQGEAPRRFKITKDGKTYRLNEISLEKKANDCYQQFTFVRKSDGQLADEKGVLGTLTLGSIQFENGSVSPASMMQLSFCYEQFLLIKENPKLPKR